MIKKLSLVAFRNHLSQKFEFSQPINAFIGANGAGKTNCLEAISMLSSGRGVRNAKLEDLYCLHAPSETSDMTQDLAVLNAWGVQALVAHNGKDARIATGFAVNGPKGGQKNKRNVIINGNDNLPQNALDDYVRVLWYLPQMARVFQEGRSARLKLLDRIITRFDKAHYGRLKSYETQMRERLMLLIQGGNETWVDTLEQEMAMRAIAIATARRQTVGRLNAMLSDIPINGFPAINIILEDDNVLNANALLSEQNYQQKLLTSRANDTAQGRMQAGIHLHDMTIIYNADGEDNEKMSAQFCSTGQQKIILLSLILAELRIFLGEPGPRPILLLDDIAAHLDEAHLRLLYDYLLSINIQLFFTGTDEKFLQYLTGKYMCFRLD